MNSMDHHNGYSLYSILFLYIPVLTLLFQPHTLPNPAYMSPVSGPMERYSRNLPSRCGRIEGKEFLRLAFRARMECGGEIMNICHPKVTLSNQLIYSKRVRWHTHKIIYIVTYLNTLHLVRPSQRYHFHDNRCYCIAQTYNLSRLTQQIQAGQLWSHSQSLSYGQVLSLTWNLGACQNLLVFCYWNHNLSPEM